jgi:glycosyltransferase involved in cell wall biosynthesis
MRISVCMATYNGRLYLKEQIDSILPQLQFADELIVVDDASRDDTIEIILSFHDDKIKLLRNEQNLGVIKSFERALMHASGDLIFLSDQDDIWRADKVETFKRFFAGRPQTMVALSDARVIDQNGQQISASWMGNAKFNPSLVKNFVKNSYLGCAMVFRRSALKYCLPFPPRVPMHDMWIGLTNQMFGEEAGFVSDPLFSYRRHGANATRECRASMRQVIRWRWNLATSLLARAIAIKTEPGQRLSS